jgi:hypothetical protein
VYPKSWFPADIPVSLALSDEIAHQNYMKDQATVQAAVAAAKVPAEAAVLPLPAQQQQQQYEHYYTSPPIADGACANASAADSSVGGDRMSVSSSPALQSAVPLPATAAAIAAAAQEEHQYDDYKPYMPLPPLPPETAAAVAAAVAADVQQQLQRLATKE